MFRLAFTRRFGTTASVRAGHSKWANIKHDKAKNDALKNAQATKHAKSIAVATKIGGGPDPTLNFQLATAIDLANKSNVSKKVIESAIKRGSGQSGQQGPSDFAVYEGMVDGVSFVVEALTDNKARSAANVKMCFTKLSGTFSPTMFMFNRQGFIKVDTDKVDDIFDEAIEAGAEDIEYIEEEKVVRVTTQFQDTSKVVQELRKNWKVVEFGLEYAPNEDMAVTRTSIDADKQKTLDRLISNLEMVDEVTNVYSNIVNK